MEPATENIPGKMHNWTVEEVCQWLYKSVGRDAEVIDEFRKQKINGFVLTKLEDKHLEKMPSVMVGDQVTILEKRNEFLAKECSTEIVFSDPLKNSTEKQCIVEQQALGNKDNDIELSQFRVSGNSDQFITESYGLGRNNCTAELLLPSKANTIPQPTIDAQEPSSPASFAGQDSTNSKDAATAAQMDNSASASKFPECIPAKSEAHYGFEETETQQNSISLQNSIDGQQLLSEMPSYLTEEHMSTFDDKSETNDVQNLAEERPALLKVTNAVDKQLKPTADDHESTLELGVKDQTAEYSNVINEEREVYMPLPKQEFCIEVIEHSHLKKVLECGISKPSMDLSDKQCQVEEKHNMKASDTQIAESVQNLCESMSITTAFEKQNDFQTAENISDHGTRTQEITSSESLPEPLSKSDDLEKFEGTSIEQTKVSLEFESAKECELPSLNQNSLISKSNITPPDSKRRFKTPADLIAFKKMQKLSQGANQSNDQLLSLSSKQEQVFQKKSDNWNATLEENITHPLPKSKDMLPSNYNINSVQVSEIMPLAQEAFSSITKSNNEHKDSVTGTSAISSAEEISGVDAKSATAVVVPNELQSHTSKKSTELPSILYTRTSIDIKELQTTGNGGTLSKQDSALKQSATTADKSLWTSDGSKEQNLHVKISTVKSSSKTPISCQPALSTKKSETSVKLIGKTVLSDDSKEKVVRKIDETTKEVSDLPCEVLRKTGTAVDITFKYRQGAKVSTSDGFQVKNFLYPIHQFATTEILEDRASMIEFCREVIKFACGCLNDRTNGTIHFGISSGNRSSTALYGEIVGIVLHKRPQDYVEFIRKAIEKCFNSIQTEAANQCILEPKFIETVPTTKSPDARKKYVIEVDVIPKYRFCKEDIFSVELPTRGKGCFESQSIFRILGGTLHQLNPMEEKAFKETVLLLAAERKELEDQSKLKRHIENDLCKKFTQLFCHGDDTLLGDHYHILVTNKSDDHMDIEFMDKALSFVADIEWKVVLDFDSKASLYHYVEGQNKPIKIIMTDDFSSRSKYNIRDPDRLKLMLDDLKKSECPAWLFANGYERQNDEPLPPRQWKKNKSEGFKDAVRFFGNQIPPGRATVVFMLLSKETDVILEAADELMTVFCDQWMCISEKEEIGKPWIEELIRRNCVEPDNFENKVVWGMPWKHVQETVTRILGPKKHSVCELPTSSGAYISMSNKINNELIDLDILSSFECDNAEIQYDEAQLKQHKKKVEEEFYKGDCVSWWNFWFHQVCSRDILQMARKRVESALYGGNEDDAVGKVFLYHQPGAGGTTVAKNILWDFRKDYRCAVVQKISEDQTARQVLQLFRHEDKTPKPVLLLLDNPDADKLNLLYADLAEMTRNIIRDNNEPTRVVCVLLVCSRCLKYFQDSTRLLLKHELSRSELNWFQDKYKYLTAEYKKKDCSAGQYQSVVDPRLLISFNVMKENFNKDYIRRTVRQLVQNVTDEKEQKLLKYISLLNTFDLECRPIPTSSLDGMMLEIPWLNQGGLRFGYKAKSNRWETKLSSEIRVLLNETSETAMGKIHSLRIPNRLLSGEILNVLKSNGSVTVGDIALEFFGNQGIFSSLCLPRDNLLDIIKDVLKRRQQNPGCRPDTAFSPLIQYIVDHESIEVAVAVMQKVLLWTSDPFIDQQLARLYIRAQNWEKAKEYAKKATDQRPQNSFLWDTYGRIYEQQLVEEYNKLARDSQPHGVVDPVQVIEIALAGMEKFRKVQETSEQEKTTIRSNKAGFFGELQMVVCLLDCLTYVFSNKDDLRRFILDEKYVPLNCQVLEDIEGHNYLEELKTLEKHVKKAMNRLEDELVQLRDDTLYEYQRTNYSKYETDSLQRLKENLDSYFGEEGDNPPGNLTEEAQCDFRRRRIFRLASSNIGSIFDLRWDPEGEDMLKRIQSIAKKILSTSHVNADDYLILICVNLALTSMSQKYLYDKEITFDEMAHWSKELYGLRETSAVTHLEPYLFYIMFNWPRKNTKHSVPSKRIETAMKQWKDAYYLKYPRQKDEGKPYRKKDTTMFFLANGSDMASVYTAFDERGSRRVNENKGRDSFWRMPETLRKLQRFDGVLSRDGNEVSVYLHYEQGNKAPITIPTSLPIRNRNMWNKTVFFVIGFSWNGPRAFDITLTDPTMEIDMASNDQLFKNNTFKQTYFFSRRPIPDYTQEDFCRELSHIMNKLKKIQRLEMKLQSSDSTYIPTQDEIHCLKQKKKLEEARDELLQNRKRGMESRIPEFPLLGTN